MKQYKIGHPYYRKNPKTRRREFFLVLKIQRQHFAEGVTNLIQILTESGKFDWFRTW
jgi:hypothetical protein